MDTVEGKETVGTPTAEQIVNWEAKAKELEVQATQLQTKLEQTEKGLRTAHQTITEKDKALKDAQDLRTVISGLRQEVDIHRAAIDELSNKPENDYPETEPPKNKKPSLDERIRQIETKTKASQVTLYADEVEKLVKEVGLDIRTAPELKAVRLAFGYQDPVLAKEALEDARSIVEGIKKKAEVQPKVEVKPEQPKETEEQLRARLEKEIMIKYKLATPEGGQPSGSGNDAEFVKKWGLGELPETKENYDRYNKIKNSYKE